MYTSWYNVYNCLLCVINSLITKWKKKNNAKTKVHLGLPYNDMNKNGLINFFFNLITV